MPEHDNQFVAVVSKRLWDAIHRDPKIAKQAQEDADRLAQFMGGTSARIVKISELPTQGSGEPA